MAEVLKGIKGFQWDKGNSSKNERKHGVTDRESEEIFFNNPLVIARSVKGSPEIRYAALGKTYGSRLLAVVFTIRANRIRIISARPMSRNERKLYEEES
ncbi:MAG TPA: BrnT family toxin [Candidatus Binatia bacterium]